MKKFNFAIAAIMSLSMLTACSGNTNTVEAPETSSEVTTSQTETEATTTEETTTTEEVTTAEETTTEATTVTESETTADVTETDTSDLVDTYANILFDKFDKMPEFPIYESEVAETMPMALCYVTFCDINNDDLPEMFFTAGLGAYWSEPDYYNTEGVRVGHYRTGGDIYNINDSFYSGGGDRMNEICVTRITDKLSSIVIYGGSYSLENDSAVKIDYIENGEIVQTYEDVKVEDVESLCEELIGISEERFFASEETEKAVAYKNYVSVPDGDTFAVEDLKNWVRTNLEEYYAVMQ